MSCIRCHGTCMGDQFYDRVDGDGRLQLGAWRWASRCPECGSMVDACGLSVDAAPSARADHSKPMPMFQMF